jgi:hypothetical protein
MLRLMNENAQQKAERLRRALRDNLKRRKSVAQDTDSKVVARRTDRLEPRLARSTAMDEPSGGK